MLRLAAGTPLDGVGWGELRATFALAAGDVAGDELRAAHPNANQAAPFTAARIAILRTACDGSSGQQQTPRFSASDEPSATARSLAAADPWRWPIEQKAPSGTTKGR